MMLLASGALIDEIRTLSGYTSGYARGRRKLLIARLSQMMADGIVCRTCLHDFANPGARSAHEFYVHGSRSNA